MRCMWHVSTCKEHLRKWFYLPLIFMDLTITNCIFAFELDNQNAPQAQYQMWKWKLLLFSFAPPVSLVLLLLRVCKINTRIYNKISSMGLEFQSWSNICLHWRWRQMILCGVRLIDVDRTAVFEYRLYNLYKYKYLLAHLLTYLAGSLNVHISFPFSAPFHTYSSRMENTTLTALRRLFSFYFFVILFFLLFRLRCCRWQPLTRSFIWLLAGKV